MKLRFNIFAVRPDMRPYRMNAYETAPSKPLILEVEVSDEHVQVEKDNLVINLAGLRELADRFDAHFVDMSTKSSYNSSEEPDEWEDEE